MQFPTTLPLLYTSSLAESEHPLLEGVLFGSSKEEVLKILNAQCVVGDLSKMGWGLINTKESSWRLSPTLCSLSRADLTIWVVNPLMTSQDGLSQREIDTLRLIRSIGPQRMIIWLTSTDGLTPYELFNTQQKMREALREADLYKAEPLVIFPQQGLDKLKDHLNTTAQIKKQEADQDQPEINSAQGHEFPLSSQRIVQRNEERWPRNYIDALVPIPTGEHIGEDGEKWTISRPFFLGQTLVTQTLYNGVMNQRDPNENPLMPVMKTSWLDAVQFCNRLSEEMNLEPYYLIEDASEDECRVSTPKDDGLGFRLPTRMEWCYAASACQPFPYSGGGDPSEVAWSAHNSGSKVHSVAQLYPNRWGLYDLSGNLWEWCHDGPKDQSFMITCASATHPKWLLGGSWANHPWIFPIGDELSEYPTYRDEFMGLRVARNHNDLFSAPNEEQDTRQSEDVFEEPNQASVAISETPKADQPSEELSIASTSTEAPELTSSDEHLEEHPEQELRRVDDPALVDHDAPLEGSAVIQEGTQDSLDSQSLSDDD